MVAAEGFQITDGDVRGDVGDGVGDPLNRLLRPEQVADPAVADL
jgi:hypothetical protein